MGFERGLNISKEVERDSVAGLDVGDIGVEAGAGVFVGEKAYVREFPAEYWEIEDETIRKWWGTRAKGGHEGLLSTRNRMNLALELFSVSET